MPTLSPCATHYLCRLARENLTVEQVTAIPDQGEIEAVWPQKEVVIVDSVADILSEYE